MSEERVKILPGDRLNDFIAKLSQNWAVLGPTNDDKEDLSYSLISGADEFQLNKGPVPVSPKELFFPQNGLLLDEVNGSYQKAYQEIEPRIIFGMRPCDVKAISILDKLMEKDFYDEYYWSTRRNTYLLSFACIEPAEKCFCTSMGGSPISEENFDLELLKMDNGDFILKSGSSKGEELITAVSDIINTVSLDQDKFVQDLKEAFNKMMKNEYVPDKAREALTQGKISEEFWQDWVNACMECGSCSFTCPTCYCFNVFDKINVEDKAERYRSWDSCVLRGYTRMAGGENPIDEIGSKNRFMTHKLVEIKDLLGEYGCVGCGRCSEVCYVNNSMADFLQSVEEGV